MNVLLNMYICALRKKSAPLLPQVGVSKMYTSGTIANSQRLPTKINKNVAVPVSGTSDTIRHLTIFKIFSHEMPVLLLILY